MRRKLHGEPLSGAASETRQKGKIRRDAEVFGAPTAHFFHERNEITPGFGERIGDFGRRIVRGFASDNAIFFEFAELCGQDFFGDAGKKIAKLGETLRAEGEIPESENFPFACEDVEGGFDGTTVVLLHVCDLVLGSRKRLREGSHPLRERRQECLRYQSLQNCAYFPRLLRSYSMKGNEACE